MINPEAISNLAEERRGAEAPSTCRGERTEASSPCRGERGAAKRKSADYLVPEPLPIALEDVYSTIPGLLATFGSRVLRCHNAERLSRTEDLDGLGKAWTVIPQRRRRQRGRLPESFKDLFPGDLFLRVDPSEDFPRPVPHGKRITGFPKYQPLRISSSICESRAAS